MDGLLVLVLGFGCLGCWVCAGLKPTKGSAGDQSFLGVECSEFTGVGTGVANGGSPDFESFDLADDLEIKSWAEGGGLGSEFTGGFALVDVDEVHWFGLVWFFVVGLWVVGFVGIGLGVGFGGWGGRGLGETKQGRTSGEAHSALQRVRPSRIYLRARCGRSGVSGGSAALTRFPCHWLYFRAVFVSAPRRVY